MSRGHWLLLFAVVTWGSAVVSGFAAFVNYETTPGQRAKPDHAWPAKTRLERVPGRFAVVALLHPRCPCSRASIAALHELSLECQSRATIDILFWTPANAGPEWTHTDLWQQAAAVPQARLHQDIAGQEARLFGAATSGQVLLYDPAGECVFRGGITAARGKLGGSSGARAVRDLILRLPTSTTETPVFGCPLYSDRPCRLPSPSDQETHRVLYRR